MYSECYF